MYAKQNHSSNISVTVGLYQTVKVLFSEPKASLL